MTWQRIDENTYIDDTLVTCAEYQLFIDEMREQEKLYQPYHWSSYQFPTGQAHVPVLGIGSDDVQAFCEWLTNREGHVWRFRTPTIDEAAQQSINEPFLLPLGYWASGTRSNPFVWVGAISINPRSLPGFPNNVGNVVVPGELKLDDVWIAVCRSPLNINRLQTLSNLDPARRIAREFIPNRVYQEDLLVALSVADNRSFTKDRSSTRFLELLVGLAGDLPRDPAKYQSHPIMRLIPNIFRKQQYSYTLDLNEAIKRTLGVFIDFFTLHERIAGRSPAFEGIRLVKERIR